jgi:adenylate cyclase class IV
MNKVNLELKHYCKNFQPIRIVLKSIGAKKEIVKNQKDYFFNLPNVNNKKCPRIKLRIENSKQSLIYYERPAFVKGKNIASDVKLYDVQDKQLLPFLITALGVRAIVEKRREVWRKNNTVFHLDNVKSVGGIFEIELQKIGGKINEKDKNIFKSYQDKLLPFLGPLIKGSNVDLVKNNINN